MRQALMPKILAVWHPNILQGLQLQAWMPCQRLAITSTLPCLLHMLDTIQPAL